MTVPTTRTTESEPDCNAVVKSGPDVSEEILEESVALLKGFADPTRLRILLMLRAGEVCVHQIVEGLPMTQSAVSHQLRTLRTARLVEFRKRGRHVYYRLADDHVIATLDGVLQHASELW